MSEDLQKLKDDYGAVKAPPGLAARLRATEWEETRSTPWLPGFAVAVLVLAVLVPTLLQDEPQPVLSTASIPSLSQLSPKKPAVTMPTLGSIRSVQLPPMPSRPQPATKKAREKKSDSSRQSIHYFLDMENHHEHV